MSEKYNSFKLFLAEIISDDDLYSEDNISFCVKNYKNRFDECKDDKDTVTKLKMEIKEKLMRGDLSASEESAIKCDAEVHNENSRHDIFVEEQKPSICRAILADIITRLTIIS